MAIKTEGLDDRMTMVDGMMDSVLAVIKNGLSVERLIQTQTENS